MPIRDESWWKRRSVAGCLVLAVAAVGATFGGRRAHSRGMARLPVQIADEREQGGSLLIAGGGCLTEEIRRRFVALAGGSQGRIVVIPASDPQPGDEQAWLEPWLELGAASVELFHAHDRLSADDAAFCAPLERATGVWIRGGYQSYLAKRYVETRVQRCLHEVLERDGVVGGSSAGAAILSQVMIEQGEISPVEARGLGLVPNAIIDQHFLWRNRLWRMQQMLSLHPDHVGFGVDERTALVMTVASRRLSVVGDSYAVICVPAAGSVPSRFEVLKPGDDVALAELCNDHLAYHPPVELSDASVAD